MGVNSAECMMFEIARDLKNLSIFLSKVRCFILYTFKTFSILRICFLKLCLVAAFYYKKNDIQ